MEPLEAAGEAYRAFIVLYAILTIMAGITTKLKNFGFLPGVILSFIVTPLITILVMAFTSPVDEVNHWWQKI